MCTKIREATAERAQEESATQGTVQEESTAQQTVQEESATQGTVQEESTAQQTVQEESIAQQTVQEESIAQRAVQEESTSSSTPIATSIQSVQSSLRIVNEYCRNSASMEEWSSLIGEPTECSLCFDPLCAHQCVVLMRDDTYRTCRHVFHESCIHDLCSTSQREYLCPLCRLSYCAGKLLPNPFEHPLEYFKALDHNNSGELDKQELIDGLNATLPLDHRFIDADVNNLFTTWNLSGSGTISYEEFSGSDSITSGLLSYIKKHYPLPSTASDGTLNIPNIREKPRDWFAFWDADKDGSLDKGEVTRAVMKTVNLLDDIHVSEFINNVWRIFDDDDNGTIDIDEFTRTDGLGDMIIANLVEVKA